jgi:hypothetical protein
MLKLVASWKFTHFVLIARALRALPRASARRHRELVGTHPDWWDGLLIGAGT